jgi:two-component sensor histidine kinase
VKNTLATVQSIASQTLRNASTTEAAREAFESRILALSRTHDVLTRENWEGAFLREVVAQALEPYRSYGEERLHWSGPKVRLSPRMALALAMALQELATNAVKYGALSNTAGRLDIGWFVERQAGEPHLHLRWEESGGLSVQAPARRGFGTRLTERSLAQERGRNKNCFQTHDKDRTDGQPFRQGLNTGPLMWGKAILTSIRYPIDTVVLIRFVDPRSCYVLR